MTMKALFQNAKNAVQSTQAKVAASAMVAMGAVGSAHAQVTGAEAAFTEIQSQGADMAGYAWPVVASITAALIGIKLFKKFVNRAS